MKRRILFTILFLSAGLFFYAQKKEGDLRISIIHIKFGQTRINTDHNSLKFMYTDQAAKPHYFSEQLYVGYSPMLYGGEMAVANMTTRKKIYIDGISIGVYGNRNTVLFLLGAGLGYEISLGEKIKIIPYVTAGYSNLSYSLGNYRPSDKVNYVVNGTTLRGYSTINLVHNSFCVSPQVSLSYKLNEFLAVKLTGGYRLDCASKEKIQFTEHYRSNKTRTATLPTDQCVIKNGSYINSKIYDLSGTLLNIGFVMSIGGDD